MLPAFCEGAGPSEHGFSTRQVATFALSLLLTTLASGCSSSPSQLYLLNSLPMPTTSQSAVPHDMALAGYGSSRASGPSQRSTAPAVAVSVTVPEYLDRADVVERTSANELKPIYSAQWGESLAVNATRTVTDNLVALLPADDIVGLPSRSRRRFDYEVNLDLTRFESDATGLSTLAGRWSISDATGMERASARVFRSEQAGGEGYAAMAAAMSRNLAAVSGEIASVLQRVSSHASTPGVTPRRAGTERARR
jgi:uncharacterized lipoprotein YmbA